VAISFAKFQFIVDNLVTVSQCVLLHLLRKIRVLLHMNLTVVTAIGALKVVTTVQRVLHLNGVQIRLLQILILVLQVFLTLARVLALMTAILVQLDLILVLV